MEREKFMEKNIDDVCLVDWGSVILKRSFGTNIRSLFHHHAWTLIFFGLNYCEWEMNCFGDLDHCDIFLHVCIELCDSFALRSCYTCWDGLDKLKHRMMV